MGLLDKAKASRAEAVADAAGRAARDAQPERRWEYETEWIREGLTEGIMGGSALARKFDRLGERGWELVQVVNDRAIFKRPVE